MDPSLRNGIAPNYLIRFKVKCPIAKNHSTLAGSINEDKSGPFNVTTDLRPEQLKRTQVFSTHFQDDKRVQISAVPLQI